MVMMNDEQHASDDLLAGSGGATSGGGLPRARGQVGDDGRAGGEASAGAGSADDAQPDPADEEAEQSSKRPLSFVAEMVVLFIIALTIALLIKTFVVQPFFIPSGSMEDTLLVGDKVLVNKVVYDLRPIGRGDIVVFDGAGSWDPPTTPTPASSNPFARVYDDTLGRLVNSIEGLFGTSPGQTDYIKRVIGIPGDHVFCCDAHGQITVNGVPLQEQSYLFPGASPSAGRFNIVVPPGRLWVMGDNRIDSADSRLHDCSYVDATASVTCEPYDRDGTIPESAVIGRAFMIVWPPSRIKILPVPSTFGQPGLNGSAGAHAAAAARAAAALDTGMPVRPSAPYLPLTAGFMLALPLTLAGRRLRRRAGRRAAAAGGEHQARRPGTRRPGMRRG
jgi:signal peptidase I